MASMWVTFENRKGVVVKCYQ